MICGARIYSSLGINHIIIKGNNDMPIFIDDIDRKYFLNLFRKKQQDNFKTIAYCLMSNHIHLLVKEKELGTISHLMSISLSAYVKWFNERHERKNSLFKKCFYSEPVENDEQLLNTIKYIHNNPLKAFLTKYPQYYPWSSAKEYYLKKQTYADINFIQEYFCSSNFDFSKIFSLSYENLVKYPEVKSELYVKSYDYICDCIENFFKDGNIYDVLKKSSAEQRALIQYLHIDKKIPNKMIAKVIGLSEKSVERIQM